MLFHWFGSAARFSLGWSIFVQINQILLDEFTMDASKPMESKYDSDQKKMSSYKSNDEANKENKAKEKKKRKLAHSPLLSRLVLSNVSVILFVVTFLAAWSLFSPMKSTL